MISLGVRSFVKEELFSYPGITPSRVSYFALRVVPLVSFENTHIHAVISHSLIVRGLFDGTFRGKANISLKILFKCTTAVFFDKHFFGFISAFVMSLNRGS